MCDSPKIKNLYLAFTPYHLLLTLIHEDRAENDIVIMVDDHGNLNDYEVAGPKLFANFFYINMAAVVSKILARQLRFSIGNRRIIDSVIKYSISEPIANIYAFNDAIPSAQYLIRKIKSNKVIYIEDGSAPYNEHYITWPLRHKLKCWFAYGFRYQFVKVLGTSSLIHESRFLNPSLVRPENKVKPYRQLFIKSDYLVAIRKMAQALSICNDVSPHKEAKALLILMPRLKVMPPYFIDRLHRLIGRLIDQGWMLYLKTHPLDGNAFESLNLQVGCEVLPRKMPAELAPATIDGLKVVIGKETTSLLAIKCLFPELKIINLIESFGAPSQYQAAMLKVDIKMSELDELDLVLQAWLQA